ncbi:MAG TPA: MarR family winged helix-turn-helix transcriptional regulator [Ramlibacter sp.]
MNSAVLQKPQGCTSLKVRQLMRRVSQHYDAEMAKCGLKTTQYSLLSHIVKLGPVRPSELAQAMQMTPSTLSRNLQPLVTAGLAVIGAGTDARSRLVQATEAGQDKRREAQRLWKVAQQTLNEQLSVERVLALHALIDDSLSILQGADEQNDNEGEGDAS